MVQKEPVLINVGATTVVIFDKIEDKIYAESPLERPKFLYHSVNVKGPFSNVSIV